MPALTAANVTITSLATFNPRTGPFVLDDGRRRWMVGIAFGNGALTYPALGVPMPVPGQFGFTNFLETLDLIDPSNSDAFLYKYDQVNQKIRIYTTSTNTELGAVAVAATTLYAEAIGW